MIKMNRVKTFNFLLFVCSCTSHAVIFDKAMIWRKVIPATGAVQNIYCFPDAHEDTIIARRQVAQMIAANSWLKNHNQQPLAIIAEGYDPGVHVRMSPLLRNYDKAQAPCTQSHCPVEFFDYLLCAASSLRLIPIDFRLIAAHASNVFQNLIKSNPADMLDQEFCAMIKHPQIIKKSTNMYQRCSLYCSYAGLTMGNLFNEYEGVRSEIMKYQDGPVCQGLYREILASVDQNAATVFEKYQPQLAKKPVYDYIMRNSTPQERAAVDLDAAVQPRTLCGLLYGTKWIQKYINARAIHCIHNNPNAARIVLALGDAHINNLAKVLPTLGYELIGEREGEASDDNGNPDLNEDGSYLEPQVIYDVLTETVE